MAFDLFKSGFDYKKIFPCEIQIFTSFIVVLRIVEIFA